jgi:hypothetical protein
MICDPAKAAFAARALALGLALGLSAAGPAPAARPEHARREQASSEHAQTAQAQTAPQTGQAASGTVARMAAWAVASGDNGGLPFVIVDKPAARIFVFRADGQLLSKAAALIGSARGDNSTPGDGNREMSAIPLDERTTPAGRFVASFGRARDREKVLWVDYATAIALHPVVTAHPEERRLQRLRSRTPRDNHITHGCINVSADFYRKVVRPTFTGTSGIVYILPEKTPVEEVFPTFRLAAAAAQDAASSAASDAALGK